jgi:hypothetical protein
LPPLSARDAIGEESLFDDVPLLDGVDVVPTATDDLDKDAEPGKEDSLEVEAVVEPDTGQGDCPSTEDDRVLMNKLQQTVEALQQRSGCWEPSVWLDARKAILKSKTTDGLGMLYHQVRVTSEWALQRNVYRAKTDRRHSHGLKDLTVHVESIRAVQWLGRANLEYPDFLAKNEAFQRKIPPPLIFTEHTVLEVAAQLRKIHGHSREIFMVTELREFNAAGEAMLSRQKGMNPCCMPLRSDIGRYVEAANSELTLKGSSATMRQHLCASNDPYVFLCHGTTVFRGGMDEGFPFLNVPFKVHAVCAGMPPGRPPVQSVYSREATTFWYANIADHNALVDRYQCLALAALQSFASAPRDEDLPILVLPALGGGPSQPIDAIVSILKNWRRNFSPFFRSVFLCYPGQKDIACRTDDAVNRSLYRINNLDPIAAASTAAKAMPWHFDTQELKMSCSRQKLEKLGSHFSGDNTKASKKGSRRPSPLPNISVCQKAIDKPAQVDWAASGEELRREASQKALAALKNLDESTSPRNSRQLGSPRLELDQETDSECDEEPPPANQNFVQPLTPLEAAPSGKLSPLPSPSGMGRSSMMNTDGSSTPSSSSTNNKPRLIAMESGRELMGLKNSAATMTGVALAGGIRNLLGIEKPPESQRSRQPSRCEPQDDSSQGSSPTKTRSLSTRSLSTNSLPTSPVRRSMQRAHTKKLKEDGVFTSESIQDLIIS